MFDNGNFFDKCNSHGIGIVYYNVYFNSKLYKIITEFSGYGFEQSFFVLESSFYILDTYGNEINFTNSIYSKDIWIILFEMKRLHYLKYRPDIVRIEFKNNIQNFNKRIKHYENYIQFDNVKFVQHYYSKNIGFYGILEDVMVVLNALLINESKKHKMMFIKTLNEFLYGYK